MTIKRLFPLLTAALTLVLLSAGHAAAGSFFGPSCYGAAYTREYPNRSHNIFGCGCGCHCVAWHPLFPRLRHKCDTVTCVPNCAAPAAAPATPEPPLPAAAAPAVVVPAPEQPH
jgi:hypothetical protein